MLNFIEYLIQHLKTGVLIELQYITVDTSANSHFNLPYQDVARTKHAH